MSLKDSAPPGHIEYRREQFVTLLPSAYRYTPSHFWLAEMSPGLWRIGLTKFAVRMLGEMVDSGYHVKSGDAVGAGQVIGWIEGFKTVSDLYCVAEGKFHGENPELQQQTTLLNVDPYGTGWLYQVNGLPDETSVDAHGYRLVLDQAIDRLKRLQAP